MDTSAARLGEPEDVVDEQQDVLLLHVAEVLRHGETGETHPKTGTRRLVHLAEHQRGVVEDATLLELEDEVVALTGPLTDTGEHGRATEVPGDPDDHLLDEHRLADTRTTEQADLSALHVRREEVDHLDAGDQHLGLALELVEGRSGPVDRPALGDLELLVVLEVEAVADGVPDVPLGHVADRDADRLAGVTHLLAAYEPIGGLQRDGTHDAVAEVLRDLQREGLRPVGDLHLGLEGVVDPGYFPRRKLDVDDRSDDPRDPADAGLRLVGGLVGNRGSHIPHSLPALASASAFAPPTISLISWVISA